MYQKHFSTRETPQSEPIPGSGQVENSAGGYAWAVDDWARLDRFLILGSEGGSYYASERQLTIDNANAVLGCIDKNGPRVVERVAEISESGRAPKNSPALFVLAMCLGLGDAKTRARAAEVLPRVARTGTHLFQFLTYAQAFRGWGRLMRQAVCNWYNSMPADRLALQIVKYRGREGWTHRDALRKAHPWSDDRAHQELYRYITDGLAGFGAPRRVRRNENISEYLALDGGHLPRIIEGYERARRAQNPEEVVQIIYDFSLPWECVPTEHLKAAEVWRALLPSLGLTALIRNLGRMTANGALKPLGAETAVVVERITNGEALRRSRVHPVQILAALVTYQSGRGARGSLEWKPIATVVDALDEAFYKSFKNVEPTGKRVMLALDVSGSMGEGSIAGVPGLTPRIGAAAMALITAAIEPSHVFTAFSHEMVPVTISPRQRLDDVVQTLRSIPMGGTDCALPMIYALKNRIPIDAFVVYTDNETWYGDIHPAQALKEYRRRMGIPAKLVVVGMDSNEFSIADPDDAGMLDVVGFDTATPGLINDFIRG